MIHWIIKVNKYYVVLLFCLASAILFCLSYPVSGQMGYGWEVGEGFTIEGIASNITISGIAYSSTLAGSSSTFSASANSTATVTYYMWSSNISGSFVNGSWSAFTSNPITYTTTLGTVGPYNTVILYVNDSLGTVGNNSVSLELTNAITASAGVGVNLSPSGSVVVAYGASQTFTYSAQDGYTISSVKADGIEVSRTGSYTFSLVTTNHTFVVDATYSAADASLINTFSVIYVAAPLLALVFLILVGFGAIKMDSSMMLIAIIVAVIIVVGLAVAFAVMSAVTNANIVV